MTTSFFLGAAIGLVAVMTPGPVSVALIDIGASRGRSSGVHAGLGVASGDLIACAMALAVVGLGSSLPSAFFTTTRVVSSMALVVIGGSLLRRPDIGHGLVERIQDPFRSMLTVTALTPSVFGAWVALFTAMPFADDPAQLSLFALGSVASSVGWHLALGGASGALASMVTARRRVALARLGGSAMLGVAAWTVF